MNDLKPSRRSYNSTLRRQHQAATRKRIVEAVAAIVAEGRLLSFSVQDVADRAGVSYPSVYRHFPTRESLLEALYEAGAAIIGPSLSFASLSPDEISSAVARMMTTFEQDPTLLQAATTALAANNIQPPSRRERDRKYLQMVAQNNPHLDPETISQAAAIICHLYSSLTWATLRQRFGLTAEASADAVTWALQTLTRDLASRDSALAGSHGER
jgi:AcrR family transcriptional regulator